MMPMWQAIPIAAVVLALVGAGFWQAEVRGSSTLFWATGLLCIALIPPCVSGWKRGRR